MAQQEAILVNGVKSGPMSTRMANASSRRGATK